MRRIWKWIVIITAYIYIPVMVTLALAGDTGKGADIAVDAARAEGKRVNIIYNNASVEVTLNDYVAMAVALVYNDADVIMGRSCSEAELNATDSWRELVKALAVLVRSDVACQMADREVIDSDRLENTFMTKSNMKALWGEDWRAVFDTVRELVNASGSEVLTYNGAYVRAMYTELSVGKTMSGAKLLGEEYAYLTQIECAWDMNSPDYTETVEFNAKELLECTDTWKKKSGMDTGIDTKNPCQDIQVIAKTDDGYITGMQVGDLCMSGEEFADMCGLKSAYLSLEFTSTSVKITRKGVGMGFGMSLYTANIMAGTGSGYQDIIKHFYPECIIGSL